MSKKDKLQLNLSDENDENFFTDVIYRTNHAFEGILKEAYQILANKNADKKNILI